MIAATSTAGAFDNRHLLRSTYDLTTSPSPPSPSQASSLQNDPILDQEQHLTNEKTNSRKAASGEGSIVGVNQRHQENSSAIHHESAELTTLPPLESIVDRDGNVVGDPQHLLDWSIVGFGKCGTTTFMNWLDSHLQVRSLKGEDYSLVADDPGALYGSSTRSSGAAR